MKRILLVIITVILLTSSILIGCSNSHDKIEPFNYDLLLQMPKKYIGEADSVEYESLEQFKKHVFSNDIVKGALATIECIDTVFYITVRHDDEDVMISGKAASKCKIVTVGETFNSYNVKSDTVVELVQDYYIIPTDEEDSVDMFESFGASFIKDSKGAVIEMKIEDGDYLLQIKEGVDYTLKIRDDVLPMESGIKYTGAIISHETIDTVQYLMPVENTQRYETFKMRESVVNIATELKRTLEG